MRMKFSRHHYSPAASTLWVLALLAANCLCVSSETTASYSISSSLQQHRSYPDRKGQDSISQFLHDLDQLSALDGQITILQPTHSKHDSSFTRNWNLEDWDRHQVRSFWRYRRHLWSWPTSPTALAVLPTVSVLLVWTILVFVLSAKVPAVADLLTQATAFPTAASLFAAPISLLLALRTNRALNRLLEARSMFGKMIRVTSGIASLAVTYLPNNTNTKNNEESITTTLMFGRYLSVYGWAVKSTFRGGEDPTQMLRTMLPPAEVQWVQQSPADLPTSIIFRLRQLLASNISNLPLAAAQALEDRLCELEMTLGVCKRLLASPIPPTYTRHTSRVLCLFLGMLPVAMIGKSLSQPGPLQASSLCAILVNITLISYVFVGIDEIGVEIEHPFPLMPMYHLAKGVQANVMNQCLLMAQGVPAPSSQSMANP